MTNITIQKCLLRISESWTTAKGKREKNVMRFDKGVRMKRTREELMESIDHMGSKQYAVCTWILDAMVLFIHSWMVVVWCDGHRPITACTQSDRASIDIRDTHRLVCLHLLLFHKRYGLLMKWIKCTKLECCYLYRSVQQLSLSLSHLQRNENHNLFGDGIGSVSLFSAFRLSQWTKDSWIGKYISRSSFSEGCPRTRFDFIRIIRDAEMKRWERLIGITC